MLLGFVLLCYADVIAVRIMHNATGEWAHEDTWPKVDFIPWALNYHFHIHTIARILHIYVYGSIQKDYFVIPSSGLNVSASVAYIRMSSPCEVHKLLQFFFVGRCVCVIHQNIMTQAKA